MSKPAAELPQAPPAAEPVEYEQPLTERMRIFLRLEFLYQQAQYHAENPIDFSARAAVTSLLEIMTILSRGDIRSEVLKELELQAELLRRFATQPGVDASRLESLLANVEQLREGLNSVGPHYINVLKDCEFLSAIKHRSAIPGGTCVFDLPDYAYWLQLPFQQRAASYEGWMGVLRPLCEAVAEVLWLVRQANEPEETLAPGGMFQYSPTRSDQPALIRVLLPPRASIYPEISGGQHRFTIRFLTWGGIDNRASQTTANVRFLLALC
jgi:cell division protein ZapD